MHDDSASHVLTLPLPRWPFLWPVLVALAYGANGLGLAVRLWHGSSWSRAGAVGLTLIWVGAGLSVGFAASANRWREIRVEGGLIRLRSGLPRWARWGRSGASGGDLEVPLARASLEWVGRTLLLHGHAGAGVRLARGRRAELAARWLEERGLPPAVGA